MIKKYKKLIIACLILIYIYIIDFSLVSLGIRPVFVIPGAVCKDGGTRAYYGLGYKAIGWKKLSVEQVDGKEVVGRLRGYDISIFPFFQDINDGPKKVLKFVPNN